MPVTNARLDEPMPWTQPGRTGMKIPHNPDRLCGDLANRAGIAKNVAALSEEERARRADPPPLLAVAPKPTHTTLTDESHARSEVAPAFRLTEKSIALAVAGGKLLRRATPKKR